MRGVIYVITNGTTSGDSKAKLNVLLVLGLFFATLLF
jgi:hypothetical protein